LLLAAAALWSLAGPAIKLVNEGGRGPGAVSIAFYRSLFAGLILLPLAWGKFDTLRRRRTDAPEDAAHRGSDSDDTKPRRVEGNLLLSLRPAALWCVVFFTAMTVCFVLATTLTKAGNAIILQYTSAFWIFALSPLLLGETPHRGEVWLLGLAMAGIAVIFVGQASTDLAGLVVALGSGLFYGLETMMIRRMRDSNAAAVIVLNLLGSAALLLPLVLYSDGLLVSVRSLLLLAFLGVVQFGLPYYLFALALVRVPAYHASLLTLLEPVLNPLWTYLAVGEMVPVTTFIGGGVILTALVLFLRAARSGQTAIAAVAPQPVPTPTETVGERQPVERGTERGTAGGRP
jgi:drug/metabolite transporter (DMT)-like permease